MIGETIYVITKAYFMIAGLFYLYSLYVNDLNFFAHVTGIIAILFLLSNIKWYFLRK